MLPARPATSGVLVICNMYTVTLRISWQVFPSFILSCKANAGVKQAKMRHGSHSSILVVNCVVLLLFVLFYVLFVFVLFYVLFVFESSMYCLYLCCTMYCLYLCCSMYCFCLSFLCIVCISIVVCIVCICVVLCIVCIWVFYVLFVFVLFYVLLVCKCVLYHCHRVLTQLQLTYISYHTTQSIAPEDGCDHRPKHVEMIGITNKPLVLHLVGVYITYVNDARSTKRSKLFLKFVQKIKTCSCLIIFFPEDRLWDVEECSTGRQATDDSTIRRKRFACWIP